MATFLKHAGTVTVKPNIIIESRIQTNYTVDSGGGNRWNYIAWPPASRKRYSAYWKIVLIDCVCIFISLSVRTREVSADLNPKPARNVHHARFYFQLLVFNLRLSVVRPYSFKHSLDKPVLIQYIEFDCISSLTLFPPIARTSLLSP